LLSRAEIYQKKFMKKQQEGYSNNIEPGGQIKVEGQGDVVKEAALPSVGDLKGLLEEAKNITKVALMSEREIDEMVERRQKSLDLLRDAYLAQESLLKMEDSGPLKDLKSDDYDRLIQEKIIGASYAELLKQLDDEITKLESLDFPSAVTKAELHKLYGVRNSVREKIESQIVERQQEIAAQLKKQRDEELNLYKRRVEELEQTIAEIESNPRVLERLRAMAEREMKEFFEERERKKKEFEAKIEQERKKRIQDATRYIQSLGARCANAFKRLGELTGNEKIADELAVALREEDTRKQQSVFDRVRSQLRRAIIDGEGEKQLKDPSEVVPWEVRSTSIPYYLALGEIQDDTTKNALELAARSGDKNAERLLKQRDEVLVADQILFRLFGKKWITDRKTNEKRLSPFWAAFETRIKNDREGITAARQKEREEAAKREAEFKQKAQEIIDRGGFVVEVPIIKIVRGKREVVGKQKGVVRLEKRKSKKGNEYWKVVEVFGITNGLKVGDVSPLDMLSFPQWFREAAKPYFVMRGEDFVERVANEEEK
jgi:hypothetical protein